MAVVNKEFQKYSSTLLHVARGFLCPASLKGVGASVLH